MKTLSLKPPVGTDDIIVLHARAHNAVATALTALREGSSPAHASRAIKALRRALPALGQIGGVA